MVQLSDEEWQTKLDTLASSKQWPELWRLAQQAPVKWSVRLMQRLGETDSDWRPEHSDTRLVFDELIRQSANCRSGEQLVARSCRRRSNERISVSSTPIRSKQHRQPELRPNLGDGNQSNSQTVYSAIEFRAATERGVTDSVTCLAISLDGKRLVSGHDSGTVRLWGPPDGKLLMTLKRHSGLVICLTITPDGQTLVSGSKDGTVRLTSLLSGRTTSTLKCSGKPVRLAVTQDGCKLAVSDGKTVGLWSIPDLTQIKRRKADDFVMTPEGRVAVIATYAGVGGFLDSPGFLTRFEPHLTNWDLAGPHTLSRDGSVFSTCWNAVKWNVVNANTVQLWSLPQGRLLRTLEARTNEIGCLAISPDGQMIASGSSDGALCLWNISDDQFQVALIGDSAPVRRIDAEPVRRSGARRRSKKITCLEVTPDGRLLVSASNNGLLQLWGLPDGRLVRTLSGLSEPINCLAITPDTRLLATGSDDGTIRLWDLLAFRIDEIGETVFAKTTNLELVSAETALQNPKLNSNERAWLEFLVTMLHWRRRFDVEISDVDREDIVGEFDIGIDE